VTKLDWQEIIRDTWQTGLVFITLVVVARVLGKTQVGQLTLYEYIFGITIGNIAATVAASEPDRVWSHFYDFILFAVLTYIVAVMTLKSRPLRKIIEGTPTIVVENGQILIDNMRGMRLDLDELYGKLREKDVLDVSEVQYAIVETSGELSVIKKTGYQNLTKTDMNINLSGPSLPVGLIMDGEVIEDNLRSAKVSRVWLDEQLSAQGISDISQVTYAGIDSKGQLAVSKATKSKGSSDVL
jgi:uncharacterized membrane protein YcaP (DUF421 family)